MLGYKITGYNGTNPEALEIIKTSMEGKIVKSSGCGEYLIKKYVSGKEVYVEFLSTGTKLTVDAKEARNGSITDPFYPSLYNIGFFGIGPHSSSIYQSGVNKSTPAYEVWHGIMKRCYSVKWQKERSNGNYNDCTVDPIWHNFQNFAGWYYSQPHYGKGFAVDKDLKMLGNRVYSPDACTMVPASVNSLFTGSNERLIDRGLPKGVHFCKSKEVFVAQIHKGEVTKSGNRKQSYLGQFKDKKPAIMAYKVAKEAHVREVADRNKDVLDDTVYENLMNYTININKWIEE